LKVKATLFLVITLAFGLLALQMLLVQAYPATYGKLQGLVTDATNSLPIPNAEVLVESAAFATPVTVFTNSLGIYEYWDDQAVSPLAVTASAIGYLPASANGIIIVAGATTTQDLTLNPYPATYGKLQGYVTDANSGLPIPNAQVTINSAAFATPVTVPTDSSGYYEYWLDQSYSPLEATASATGYLPDTATGIIVNAGETTTQDFELQRGPDFVVPELPFGTITALSAAMLGFAGFYSVSKHRKRA